MFYCASDFLGNHARREKVFGSAENKKNSTRAKRHGKREKEVCSYDRVNMRFPKNNLADQVQPLRTKCF